jgi:hypothetical protein
MRNILEKEIRRARRRSRHRRTPPLHACNAGYHCTRCLTHPACHRLPARLLSAPRSFPTTTSIPPPPLVVAIGLRLALGIVVVPVARVAVSGIPNIGVGRLEPPSARAWRRAASAASFRSASHRGGQGCLRGLTATLWVSRSHFVGILGVAAALLLQGVPQLPPIVAATLYFIISVLVV